MPMANKRRKGDEERPPMADGMLDPLDNFVGRFRMMCGGDHVMVGPPGGCTDDPKVSMDRQVIQVIGPARGMTLGLCASNWYFDVPHSLPSHERHKFMRDMQAMLAGLLNRDFATVEIASYSSIIEFARAVEARWPCPQATATRERLEARQPRDEGQERRRRVSV
jgi:hypothetical protein